MKKILLLSLLIFAGAAQAAPNLYTGVHCYYTPDRSYVSFGGYSYTYPRDYSYYARVESDFYYSRLYGSTSPYWSTPLGTGSDLSTYRVAQALKSVSPTASGFVTNGNRYRYVSNNRHYLSTYNYGWINYSSKTSTTSCS